MNYSALIPSAGVGSRFGAPLPKQYHLLNGKMVLQHTIDIFAHNPRIQHIAIIVAPHDQHWQALDLPPHARVYPMGGNSRAQTVANGLNHLLQQAIIAPDDFILVHDAVRCALPQSALNRLLEEASNANGGILAMPVTDTLKKQNDQQNLIDHTLPRDRVWQAQTPQMFPAQLLHQALQHKQLSQITDEASAVEALGVFPKLVMGDARNMKLTHPHDVLLMQWLIQNA